MAEADKESTTLDIVEVRKRLGLTEDQMASALNVTTRTLQNFRELLALIDDYVVSSKEREWLETPLPALRGQKPIDLIREGKLRDLIVEFQRMCEGLSV